MIANKLQSLNTTQHFYNSKLTPRFITRSAVLFQPFTKSTNQLQLNLASSMALKQTPFWSLLNEPFFSPPTPTNVYRHPSLCWFKPTWLSHYHHHHHYHRFHLSTITRMERIGEWLETARCRLAASNKYGLPKARKREAENSTPEYSECGRLWYHPRDRRAKGAHNWLNKF